MKKIILQFNQRDLDFRIDLDQKKLNIGELEVALQVEKLKGVTLKRIVGLDWIDNNGKYYDALGSDIPNPSLVNLENFKKSILSHIDKSDYPIVDLRQFTFNQRIELEDFVESLNNSNIILF